ncbi:hypothetical cytosolic protein [Syntrophus aciditrophicus SB]|jgi:hypothetical protein|uniref:Hypothetical cytosolic protein n=1 Tax=Syntrophus aciditrophicus (strain SB) TaxID=56780 RepID=Q2LY64_SYNAS|nr:hypothetical cytosolic protein [Syntrophus aciditrophicus SB]
MALPLLSKNERSFFETGSSYDPFGGFVKGFLPFDCPCMKNYPMPAKTVWNLHDGNGK